MTPSKIVMFTLLLVGPAILGQSREDAAFWREPDAQVLDNVGKVTAATIKDRSHFTARVLRNGEWLTYHYTPHTEQVLRVEARDSADDYSYNAKGETVTQTVHVRGLALKVTLGQQALGADGMPQVMKRRDSGGREASLATSQGSPIADFHLRKDGSVERIDVGRDLQLTILKQRNQQYREALIGHNGRTLAERVVSTSSRRPPALVMLDPIARELGLTTDWDNTTKTELNATGSLITVRNRAGSPILYVVRAGADMIGYDTRGNALFYDLAADIHSGPSSDPDTKVDEFAFVPDHFVLTHDGRLAAYVATPAPNAIASFWTERDAAGNTTYAIRSGEGVVSTAKSAPTSTSNTTTAVSSRGYLRRSVLAAVCSTSIVTTQTCYFDGSGNSLGCGDPTYTEERSCYDDGAAPFGGGGGAGGGGGGTAGGGASNHVTGNATMYGHVATGLANASTKLPSPQCSGLLSSLTNSSGQTLASIMQARGTGDPVYYLQNLDNFKDGTGVQN